MTCMDELAIMKHTGDAIHLEQALQRTEELELFYNFEYLAQLFVGQCVRVDDKTFCPHEAVHVG